MLSFGTCKSESGGRSILQRVELPRDSVAPMGDELALRPPDDFIIFNLGIFLNLGIFCECGFPYRIIHLPRIVVARLGLI